MRWGQPVVVENRPGGDGLIAIGAFVSAADDHVLLYASSATFIAHPYVHDKLPYNLERDLQPIARVSHTVLSIAAASATAFRTIADFVAAARADPDKYNVAGAAGLPEFTLDAFVKAQSLKVTTSIEYLIQLLCLSALAADRTCACRHRAGAVANAGAGM